MTELRSAVLRSPDLTEADRLALLQLYDLMREKYEVSLRPQKKGARIGLVGALDHAATNRGDRAGGAARLLAAAKTTIAGVVAAPPKFRVDQPPVGTDLIAMFDTIVAGQRAAINTASLDDLTAASRAYVGSAARRH